MRERELGGASKTLKDAWQNDISNRGHIEEAVLFAHMMKVAPSNFSGYFFFHLVLVSGLSLHVFK